MDRVALLYEGGHDQHWLVRKYEQMPIDLDIITSSAVVKGPPSMLREYDYVIFFDSMLDSNKGKRAVDIILSHFKEPIAMLDDRDDPVILRYIHHPNLKYFKREFRRLPWNTITLISYNISYMYWYRTHGRPLPLTLPEALQAYEAKSVLPLPLSISSAITDSMLQCLQGATKIYSVSMVGVTHYTSRLWNFIARGASPKRRLLIAKELSRIPNSFVLMGYKGDRDWRPLSLEDYIITIARSTSSVATRGSGFDTYRYYEIPALNSVLLADTSRIVIPNDFVAGKEAIFFSEPKELASIVETLVSDEKLTRRIAEAGHKKYEEYHTPQRRLIYLMEELKR
ncbi:MAG: glycosyltransferase [Conexivisphaerales archaeon]